MTINCIEIENVRGIELLKISDKILKNRPNILVAANGFGKTSFAVAFKCIASQTSLKLPDEARHQHSATKPAKINLDLDDIGLKKLSVTEAAHSNEIRKNLDIHVIGDMRRIKTSARNRGSFTSASAKQVIDPIVICNKPNKVDNPYKITSAKQELGNHGRLLQNLDNALFSLPQFIMRSTGFMEAITQLIKERRWTKIEAIRAIISAHDGDDAEALNAASADIQQILTQADFKLAAQIILDTSDQDENAAFLSIWQLGFVARKSLVQLRSYFEWLRYKEIKKSLKSHVADLNSSWKSANVNETPQGKLVVELPDPSHISNGQRDILLLVAMFHVAKHQLTKEKAILIIDEVFDYLDDANLTVAQYYITELIEDYKRQGRAIYPIILTHLNPAFFKNYVFSNQNVIYLDKYQSYDSCDAMKALISARNDKSVAESIRNKISKYLVHYYAAEFDFFTDLGTIKGTRPSWGKHGRFQTFTEEEFNKYRNKQAYDPLAICAITRRTIEMLAYRQIEHLQDANCFFDVHKTGPKLDWASKRGADVPETHYLLRVIFDDGLHWNLSRDNTVPIVAKLGNPIIMKLIVELVSPQLSIGITP